MRTSCSAWFGCSGSGTVSGTAGSTSILCSQARSSGMLPCNSIGAFHAQQSRACVPLFPDVGHNYRHASTMKPAQHYRCINEFLNLVENWEAAQDRLVIAKRLRYSVILAGFDHA